MRIALATINPTIGDLDGNARLISGFVGRARDAGASLVVFPELAVCGYPPRDLLLQEGFVRACGSACARIARACRGITAVVGAPTPAGKGALANSLVVLRDGRRIGAYAKRLLPTYDVFDEDRYFRPGDRACVVRVGGAGARGGIRVGLSICEDLWRGEDAGFPGRYLDRPDPVADLARAGVDVIINPSASPFVLGKGPRHRAILARTARRHGVYVAAVNQVGGNDELIFDGHAAVFGPSGALAAAGAGFREELLMFDVPRGAARGARGRRAADPLLKASEEELLFAALTLGVRDYLRKTGFSSAIIGLSGGIDSALTACIAAAALGPANVLGVAMPGPYSSDHARADAFELARRLGVACVEAPIAEPMSGFRGVLDGVFGARGVARLGERLPDLTEENLQSRLRGTTLMALSNRTGAIVLTTGNKSEMAVGYCTLYGDMNGGLGVLSDLTKRQVYALSRWINEHHRSIGLGDQPPIPESTLGKAPSAELRPDQKDQDSLPPYDELDAILALRVQGRLSPATIARRTGLALGLVERITRMIDLSEYKRRQAAVGLKVTGVAFGSGRRMPIARGWIGR